MLGMPQRETYRKTIEEAAVLAGGILNLSVRLRVDMATLQSWLADRVPVPEHAFLDAVDVITAEQLRTQTPFFGPKKPQTD